MSTDPGGPAGRLGALVASVQHLRTVVTPLGDDVIERQAYPSEWSIADVLSHVGSGAVIQERRFDDALAGRATPDTFAPTVWDEWNAKLPRAKVADALRADDAFTQRLVAATDAERAGFAFSMGPIEVDFDGFVGLRLNEHVLHTWDVEVALDEDATLGADAAAVVIDNLGLIARFTARPTGATRTITVQTTEPGREFTIDLAPESVAVDTRGAGRPADLVAPAEAFVRLVYGRLDPAHTPPVDGDAGLLDELRRVFPGP